MSMHNGKSFIKSLRGDILGGLTSGIIAIPLALAFGVACGLGATPAESALIGLYGAIILCFVGAIFGGAATQISGPTAPMTVVVLAAMASFNNDSASIFAIFLLAGILQILLSFTKISRVVKYVPYPVISGFMSGIGAIIIIMQSNVLLGAKVAGKPLTTLLSYGETYHHFNIESIILSVITLVIVFFTPQRVNRIIPSALIALVVGTLVSISFGFNVDIIGQIKSALPVFHMPNFTLDNFSVYLPVAMTLAVIGAVDSLLTALVIDSVTKTKHDPDGVLFGQGIGNALVGMFGGIAGAGATMRTVVNIKSGGRTRLSAIIHAMFLLCLLLGAAPLVAKVPMAVLAGILVKVASDIIDFKFLKVIKYAPRHDLYVMSIVFILTVFYDLIFAVGAGITLAALLFAKNSAEKTRVAVKEVQDKEILKIESQIEQESHHKIRVVHIEGDFFFGSSTQIISHFDELLGTKYLVLNYDSESLLDISAIFALEDIIVRLRSQRIRVLMVIKNHDIENQLIDLGIIQQIGPSHLFYDELEAVNKAKEYLKRKVATNKRKLKNAK